MTALRLALPLLAATALAACSQGGDGGTANSAAAPAPASDPALAERLAKINDATFASYTPGEKPRGVQGPAESTGVGAASLPALVKAQVLLARANFSPGEIDGREGSNLRHAIAAYAQANGLASKGELTQEVWDHLTANSPAPVVATYALTQEDVDGPWSPDTQDDLAKAKGLDRVGFTNPLEALGEKVHGDVALLTMLNPGLDLKAAGVVLIVPQVGDLHLAPVDHVEVDKASAAVRGYDAEGKLIAFFPATVGSTERPSPSGVHKVQGVARDPDYVYDPKKLTWGPRSLGKFVVKPGPNNPVGAVWIDLDAPTYGLHGSPEPHLIGKTASHGCVRMTNWDALLLASAVKRGVEVEFLKARRG